MKFTDDLKQKILNTLKKQTRDCLSVVENVSHQFETGEGNFLLISKDKFNGEIIYDISVYYPEIRGYLHNVIFNNQLKFKLWFNTSINVIGNILVVNYYDERIGDRYYLLNQDFQYIFPFYINEISNYFIDNKYMLLVFKYTYEDNRNKQYYNFLNEEGQTLFDEWFDGYPIHVSSSNYVVHSNKGYNIINLETGKLFFDEWFPKDFMSLDDNHFVVKKNNKYNIITSDGKILSKYWFDTPPTYLFGGFLVKLKNRYNILKKDGTFALKDWYINYFKNYDPQKSKMYARFMNGIHNVVVYEDGKIEKETL